MWEKANGKDGEKETEESDEEEVSLYDTINVLVAHGHNKDEILKHYSKDEITMFYEKCVKLDMRNSASFIESVIIGVGGAFGGGKQVEKILAKMRE
nr:MAG TPA: hypothetical protein [Caudoviricetes sp.]